MQHTEDIEKTRSAMHPVCFERAVDVLQSGRRILMTISGCPRLCRARRQGFGRAPDPCPSSKTILPSLVRLCSREKDFFAQLEDDFELELVDPRSCEPLTASKDLEGRIAAGGKSAINRHRGVFLLLGARRGHRCTEGRPSPLDKWPLNR